MKKALIILFLLTGFGYSQNYKQQSDGKFYMGFGTSVSSFIGGKFGKTFGIRMNYSPNYYDRYGYNNYSYSNSNNDSYLMWSPIQLDLNLGYFVSKKVSIEAESSFIWHLRGRLDPDFVTGTEDGLDYIDQNDNSTLFSIPLTVNAKFFPLGRAQSFFIKGGIGFQYVRESAERVREYYSYDDPYYGYSSSKTPIASYHKTAVLPGVKLGAGLSYSFFESLNAFTEIEYSYYYNKTQDNTSPLAINNSRYTSLLALNTKIYFTF